MELVSPLKVSMNFLSLISASDAYSFQYAADVSPYLATWIILSQREQPHSKVEAYYFSHLGS